MNVAIKALVTLLLLPALLLGCKKAEEKKAGLPAPISGHSAKKDAVVVVPDSVKGKWKAVKIAVTNKQTNRETVYAVPIGSDMAVAGTELSIKVDPFLPHFMMEGTPLTSQPKEPQNPAAQITIMEGGKEIFRGWLFSLYPTTHAFQHPVYGFTLVDFVPAR